MIYLASQSPRRAQLLTQIGVTFNVLTLPCDFVVDESTRNGEHGLAYVQRLAFAKARAGLDYLHASSAVRTPVLGADTAVVVGREILGKPNNKDDAVRMLTLLSGTIHQVYTGVTVITEHTHWSCSACTHVSMMRLSAKEIDAYWRTGEPVGKAGAYAVQGRAAVFIEGINGSFSNVVGLPLFETRQLLQRVDVPLWDDGKLS